MRHTQLLTVCALALTCALGVSGCSGGGSIVDTAASRPRESFQPAELNASPATGDVVTGDGYSYAVPVGWSEQDSAQIPGVDTVASDASAAGSFANNVNVVLSAAGLITADQVESMAPAELEASGATGLTVLDRLTVADSESAHITADMTASGISYVIHQYYVSDDDQTYIVTFSYADTVGDDEALAIQESVLATWLWS
jgi:hypothetical protein